MTALVRSELIKAFSTRTAWAMPLAMFLVTAAFTAIGGFFLVYAELPVGGTTIRARDTMDEAVLARMVYTGAVQMASWRWGRSTATAPSPRPCRRCPAGDG